MIIKALGGIGKAIIGLGGSVVKTGAKIFGDDAVEAVGRGVGNVQKGIDDIVQHAVKQDEIYKAAKNKARGIKEATKDTSKAAEEAISKPKFKDDGIRFTKDDVTYERHRNPNWHEGDARKSPTNPNGHNQFLYTANGKPISGKQFGQEKAEFVRNKGTVEQITDNATENFLNNTIEKWDGLPNWAKYTGIATASGIAGAVLFGDDDDNDN